MELPFGLFVLFFNLFRTSDKGLEAFIVANRIEPFPTALFGQSLVQPARVGKREEHTIEDAPLFFAVGAYY